MSRLTYKRLFTIWMAFVIMADIVVAARERHHRRAAQAHIASASAYTASTSDTEDGSRNNSNSHSWSAEMALLRRLYDDCSNKNDFIVCLKEKALTALTRAVEKDNIKIADGLVFEKLNQTEPTSLLNTITDARSFNSMAQLDQSLLTKADQLLRTHALKLDIGTGRDGKSKKHYKKGGYLQYVIAALVTAMGIAGPLGLKALAAVAIKALVISKVALTIASIIALKKLFSNEHGEESSIQVHAGEHNRRSTFVIRPLKSNGQTGNVGVSPSVDPYRYYYEYH